ncbi:MAG: phosphoglucomutase/phosphomannomutase family protein [Chlorobi bacterium]|nr:phosphoglucomutase/phosphomannomutase family protein [Chlorobiota bacterium]
MEIKFGTDGWRAIIGYQFTTDNVSRIVEGTAQWLKKQDKPQKVVIGRDTRFAGEVFMDVAVEILTRNGIEVIVPDTDFVTTPMLSLATKTHNAGLGIMFTASHNPPIYHGYKLKADFGGPLPTDQLKQIEELVPFCPPEYAYPSKAKPTTAQLEDEYYDYITKKFDLDAIRKLKIAYDAMYGSGQRIMKRLLPNAHVLHGEVNPSFKGIPPEPIEKNLKEAIEFMKTNSDYELCLATDGDADRIALIRKGGKFLSAQHLLLLLVHYLAGYKKEKGKIVVAVSATERLRKLAKHYELDIEYVPVGFKHIAPKMVEEDVLLGGEESGGIGIKGHIPERDGIFVGLTIAEFIATSGKSLDGLVNEVYEIVGEFEYVREDLHLSPEQKEQAIQKAKAGIEKLGKWTVTNIITIDGFKFILGDKRWLLVRPSGTEPVLRLYAEAPTEQEAKQLIAEFKKIAGIT